MNYVRIRNETQGDDKLVIASSLLQLYLHKNLSTGVLGNCCLKISENTLKDASGRAILIKVAVIYQSTFLQLKLVEFNFPMDSGQRGDRNTGKTYELRTPKGLRKTVRVSEVSAVGRFCPNIQILRVVGSIKLCRHFQTKRVRNIGYIQKRTFNSRNVVS